MKPTRPSDVRALLERLDFKPRRALGQNFLIDANIQRIIVDTAEVCRADEVLEIGPGLGVLTGPLLAWAARVVAIEKDPRLFAYLKEAFGERPELELLCADALECDLQSILASGINKVVSNLPYSTGTRILLELCRSPHRPRLLVVTLQLEVAERLAAAPATPAYGLASVMVQLDYRVSLARRVPRTCFYPVPQVDSAVVVLERQTRPAPVRNETALLALLRHCFEHRRKQLGHLLKTAAGLPDCGFDLRRRPETLSPAEWIALSNRLEELGRRPPL